MKVIVSRQTLHCIFCLLILSLLTLNNVSAAPDEGGKNYYISPKLQLGIHTQASFNSPIRALISSGAKVKVLKKKHAFSQIKTAKGTIGWVKSKFLTQEEPLIKKIKKLEIALKNNHPQKNEQNTPLTIDSTWQAQKQSYEETIAMLKEELKAWEQLDVQDKEAQKIQMKKDNQQLKERLSLIAKLAIGNNSETSITSIISEDNSIVSATKSSLFSLMNKNYLLLIMVSGIGFLLGIFIMDVINRRRHGGYRV